jgi:hypothetical protein
MNRNKLHESFNDTDPEILIPKLYWYEGKEFIKSVLREELIFTLRLKNTDLIFSESVRVWWYTTGKFRLKASRFGVFKIPCASIPGIKNLYL